MSDNERRAVTVVVGGLDPLLRFGLEHVLAADPGVELLGSDLKNGALEDVVARRAPRVVILGERSEYALLVRLKSRRQPPGVLVLVQQQLLLSGALAAAGAICLARDATAADILAAVHRVAAHGEVSVSADARGVEPRDAGALTRRQMQVFRYLSEDMPYAVIALDMKIGVATVRTHARAVFRKLGVRNRHELVGRTLRGGSLSGPM